MVDMAGPYPPFCLYSSIMTSERGEPLYIRKGIVSLIYFAFNIPASPFTCGLNRGILVNEDHLQTLAS